MDDNAILLEYLIEGCNIARDSDLLSNPLHYCIFIHSLLVYTIDIYKKNWYGPNYEILRSFVRKPSLFHHIESKFSTEVWIECLMIILRSPARIQLVERCNKEYNIPNEDGFFLELFYAFGAKKVGKNDRVKIIATFLDLGLFLTIHDASYALELYGFDEEVEALIYHTKEEISINPSYKFPLPTFIFGWGFDFDQESIFKLFRNLIETEVFLTQKTKEHYLGLSLKYFSMSSNQKEKLKVLIQEWMGKYDEVFVTIDLLPVFPTLKELCRNALYRSVRKRNNFGKVLELHDALKSLEAPSAVVDIIRFKKSIY